MLADSHLSVPLYVANSDELFPGTDIKGGIAVTYRDGGCEGEPIRTFTAHPELNEILHKVIESGDSSLDTIGITSSRSFRYTDRLYGDHPTALELRPEGNAALVNTNTFEQFGFLYEEEAPSHCHDYVQVLGLIKNRRVHRWLPSNYIAGPSGFDRYRVVVPAANGSGQLGEVLSSPHILAPRVAVTQSFITIGSFTNQSEAEACLAYIKTKFTRAMLGILKITQHNPARVWRYVPLQDFTENSDIDWSKSIPEIDQQLYAKYGLSDEEVEFIETHVKSMD